MKTQLFNPHDDLEMAGRMLKEGQKAASFDGVHLMVWGSFVSLGLLVQYFAEVNDWLPSAILWLWQPVFIAALIVTLYMGRRSLINRMRNSTVCTYSVAFSAIGIGLLIYAMSGLSAGRPDAFTFSLLLCASLGSAFFTMASVTKIRELLLAALGWWGAVLYFGFKGTIAPSDFLVLSFLFVTFVVCPGAFLTRKLRKLKVQ